MASENPKSLPVIGFLTVVENDDVGLCGGYLLLNQHGRPVEFHCTAPVKPNRAQQILYGPTLAPYLYGEQIGETLFSAAAEKPLVVCTDVDHALALRDLISIPVVLIRGSHESSDQEKSFRVDPAHGPNNSQQRLVHFTLNDCELAVAGDRESDQQAATEHLGKFVERIDFDEPFDRIHEAIKEALRGAK